MATKTPKYELQKKEDNDFYNIEDINANWDKVENALTEFDDSGTAEGITSFTDMLAKLVTGNKLAVTLRNLKAGLQFVLHTGSIVNNCVTDNAKLPLSAAQGKVLQDAITKLNGDLANAIASKPCNLSGGTVEFIIDISNLQIKRFALHVTCSGSIWAEFVLLIISYSDLSASLEEAGITKVKLYSTYDSKMIFKACTVQGSNGKIRIQAQNNYGEACMVSIISPYK